MDYSRIILPDFEATLKMKSSVDDASRQIYDTIRRRWVKLTPEEWVRQNMLQYFVKHRAYPEALIACEATIEYNSMSKRCDAIVYNVKAEPILIMEFKAQRVQLTQDVFDQISVYNMCLNVPYLFVSNGIDHVFCKVDTENNRLLYSDSIPNFQEL